MPSQPPVVLTIAGFDPSSGAGITADVKTIAAHDCYGVCCITALTVQSTQGVRRVEAVDPGVIRDTLDELASDLEIQAIHIGMLGSAPAVEAIIGFLGRTKSEHVVLDPILKSTSGKDLLDPSGRRLVREKLIPLCEVITPNLDEATVLTGRSVTRLEEMKAAAEQLHSLGAANVVVTGGHLVDKAVDLLSFSTSSGTEQEVFKADHHRSNSTHGTGCAFATAMACHLAHGRGLPEAVLLSKAYVRAAIANAYPLGKGTGPVHHLYRMHRERRRASLVANAEVLHP